MSLQSEPLFQSSPPDLGVYVHVPFCERVCPYCDFAVVAGHPGEREERTVSALVREIEGRAHEFPSACLATVYLGGGTPSLLRPDSVARILAAASRAFPGEASEVTLEVNPSTTERAQLAAFREAGVNRLSLGIQSFDDATLKRLGRAHLAAECHATIDAARRAGFDNLSIDLIFGVHGQGLAAVLADVAAAVGHAPEHVSAYGLSVEPGTPLARAVASEAVVLPEDDLVADMMLGVAEALKAAGLERYEVSNYARPGREAVHNARYWQRRAVLGVGIGAHSYVPASAQLPFGSRPANARDLATWLARIATDDWTPSEAGPLSETEARSEAVFLALRQCRGLAAGDFQAEWGAEPRAFWPAEITELVTAQLVAESSDGDLSLTTRGWLMADSVFECFVSPAVD